MSIKLLQPEVFNKIAAGEVVENPSSVVKELVENSIDAEAEHIKIKIADAGKKEITIVDNGRGIDKEEIPLAFLKHSTSKIDSVNDLEQIFTLGFRGEALASIASVAKVTLVSKTEEAKSASKVIIENSKLIKQEDVARSIGTTIIVKDLFYSVPARLKFLKTNPTEIKHIKQILLKIALANPYLHLEFINEGKEVFNFTPVSDYFERVVQVYGKDYKNILIPIVQEKEGIQISAYVGKPHFAKNNRNYQLFFINKRAVDVNFFYPLLRNIYDRLLVPGKHPIAFLFMTIDPKEIDVNVHPSKKEIRFRNSQKVFDFLYHSIRPHLISKESIPDVQSEDTSFHQELSVQSQNLKKQYKQEIVKSINTFMSHQNQPNQDDKFFNEKIYTHKPDTREVHIDDNSENEILSGLFADNILILGQLFQTYILIESGDTFFIIDQHAAHERIIYERIKKSMQEKKPVVQDLLIPFNVTLEPVSFDVILEKLDVFKQLGYEIEVFGDNTFIVRSVPAFIRQGSDKGFLMDLFDSVLESQKQKITGLDLIDRMLETLACRSAIKAGDEQNMEQMESLIEQLLKLDNIVNCPHGRPVIIKFQKNEIEKFFVRKV